MPFTLRKLLNRIQAFAPHQEGKVLQRGPLTLYQDCHLVQVNGSNPERLTPTLSALLQALMQRPEKFGSLGIGGEAPIFRGVDGVAPHQHP